MPSSRRRAISTPREKRGYYVADVGGTRRARGARPGARRSRSARGCSISAPAAAGRRTFPFFRVGKAHAPRAERGGRGAAARHAAEGADALRRAIAQHLYRFRGISAAPEQIVVGAGTEYLYNLIVQLLGREAVYGVEDPATQGRAHLRARRRKDCARACG